MGMPPQKIAEFDAYLQTLVPLLRGRGLAQTGDSDIPIRHIMPEDGFVNFKDPIPLLSQALAQGLSLLRAPTAMALCSAYLPKVP